MEKTKSVFDAGPFIHLHEIHSLHITSSFSEVLSTPEILDECSRIKKDILALKNAVIKHLLGHHKDLATHLTSRYDIEYGEATGIALCRQEKIKHFFTDDLDARETAKTLGLEVHGTLAIILRSLRKNTLTKKQASDTLTSLYYSSSLYLTKELYEYALKEVEQYRPKAL